MVKNVFEKDSFVEVEVAYTIKQTTYYYLRVNKQTIDDEHVSAIVEILDHAPTEQDKKILYQKYLAMLKSVKLGEIIDYDKSDQVNVFEIDGQRAWLDKATRVGLMNSLQIEKEAKHETTSLYLNGIQLVLPVDKAIEMLNTLELYAIECYRKTEEHKTNVIAISVIEDAENYDIKSGYPEHPVFSTKNKE